MIHIGNLVEAQIRSRGITKAEFGRRISTSRQNVNSLLHRESWDTHLLIRAGKALECNFFDYFTTPTPDRGEPPKRHYILVEIDPQHHKHLLK